MKINSRRNNILKLPDTATIPAIARRLGISTKTIRRWYHRNKIRGYLISKKLLLIDLDSLNKFLDNFKNY